MSFVNIYMKDACSWLRQYKANRLGASFRIKTLLKNEGSCMTTTMESPLAPRSFIFALVVCLCQESSQADLYDDAPVKPEVNEVAEANDMRHLMSIEAEQVLFQMKKELGFEQLTGSPIPLYRKDLPRDYVAYWQVEFDERDVIIISAGPQTGDKKFILQSRLPAPTVYLDNMARDHNAACFRFFILSPMGEMMCENEEGQTIASNIDNILLRNVSQADPYSTLVDQFIKERLCDIRVKWTKHAAEVARTGQWKDETVTTEDALEADDKASDDAEFEDVDPDADYDDDDEESFNEIAVAAGDTVRVALGNLEMLRKVHIRYLNMTELETNTSSGDEMQAKLCSVITICSINGSDGLVDQIYIQEDSDTGLGVLEFQMGNNITDVFDEGEFDFAIEIHRQNEQVVVRNYAATQKLSRHKRFKEYRSWSSWYERSIGNEDKFPHYSQHNTGSCAVGCGPVAWAMIFGYYDRRSHDYPWKYGSGSQGLYRSGCTGVDGSNSRMAPSYSDTTMKRYTEKLNDILGTWCIFGSGATLMSCMKRVEDFFQDRQTTGNPRVVKDGSWLTLLGVYRESIARWTRARIYEGWPVIVGTKKGWFTGWHYPVATKYRTRRRSYRNCVRVFWKICGSWKTEIDNDMYLHMGWGGKKDGWYAMKSFFSITAKY